MPSAISLVSSSIASLTGISSASVTSTAEVRDGSHSIALTVRASRVSGPSGTVSTITHGTRSIDTE